jgi:transposase
MEEGAMAKKLLPDALWARIAPLLPPEPPKPKGGRPRGARKRARTQRIAADRAREAAGQRHLVVDAHGIPVAVPVSAANVHDSKMMLATVDAIEPIRAAGAVADHTSSMPTRVTTTVTYVWPCASAASSPASPAVVSSPRTAWNATGGWSNGRSPG